MQMRRSQGASKVLLAHEDGLSQHALQRARLIHDADESLRRSAQPELSLLAALRHFCNGALWVYVQVSL